MQYINGTWIEGNGAAFTSENPATGDIIWEGKSADSVQVEAAVAAARDAFEGWADTPFEARVEILSRFRDALEARKEELSALISEEVGKAPWDANAEAAATIGKLKASLQAFAERTPSKETAIGSMHARLTHRPHGVMAVYGPYNFPSHLPNGHITPALLAGNSIVFKPSELTPKTAEWTVKRWEEAGLPAGVLNLVQGEKETGIALSHADIDGLLFTGSSQTGKKLHELFAGKPEKLLALELGGNNPLIVNQVSDIKAAVLETINSAYINSGQRCTCARRLILVSGDWNDTYLSALTEAIQQITIGAYTDDPAPYMGPVISNQAAEQLLKTQADLIDNGGEIIIEMKRLQPDRPFLSPGLIDISRSRNVPDEEHFGPLLKLIRVPDLDTAIRVANETAYGLSASLLSDNSADFDRFLRRSHAGLVNWNQATTGASGMAPFGGVGCSGNHHPAGYYAADYCAYPVASMTKPALTLPETLPPGLHL